MTRVESAPTGASKAMAFGTLWVGGNLSPMEQACLNSFVALGERVTLFSYDPIANLPEGVLARDANAIVDRQEIGSYLYNGKPDLAHFSDLFRYVMIKKTGLCWVDTDIFLLKPFDLDHVDHVVGREPQGTINGAVLRLEDAALIDALIDESTKLKGKNMSWGESGPLLLQRLLKARRLESRSLPYNTLYPIDHDNIYKVFSVEHLEWCRAACADQALTLHLFNNVIVRMGVWKIMAPPQGSFFHHLLDQSGGLKFFSGTYPAAVMQHITGNFVRSQTGSGLGFGSVVKQVAPSFARSLRHRNISIGKRGKVSHRNLDAS